MHHQAYTIIKELGQGGMATVYLAEDKKFQTQVALKVLNKDLAHNENIRKRFLAEARNMYKMSHPNIIKVTDLIDEGDTVAFVMEHIDGETLKEFLDRKGKLSDDEIRNIFSQMLEAVGYVHEQGLIHRDIKPSNFMIDKKGKVKLLDFGIAKNTDTSSAEYTQTGTGMQMGTPMYMSPEQITETKSVTAQSDIYSLGVVLWQLVTGERPYNTATLSTFQLQLKIVNEPLAFTGSAFDAVIKKATEKDAANRYASADDFLNIIQSKQDIADKTVISTVDEKTQISNLPGNLPFVNKSSEIIDKTLIQQNLNESNLVENRVENKISHIQKSNVPNNKKISDNEVIVYEVELDKILTFIDNYMVTSQYKKKSNDLSKVVYEKGTALKQAMFGSFWTPNFIVHVNHINKQNMEFNCTEYLIKVEVQSLGLTGGLIGIPQRINEQNKFKTLIEQLINFKN